MVTTPNERYHMFTFSTVQDLELTDTPILSLLFLFLANVVCRGLAVAIMHSREKRKYQLKVKV